MDSAKNVRLKAPGPNVGTAEEFLDDLDRPEGTIKGPCPTRGASSSGWFELRVLAENFADFSKAAVSIGNRVSHTADPEPFAPQMESIRAAADTWALALRRAYRRVASPQIRAWQQEHPGLGEHLVARLLGHLGHPVHAEPHHWEGDGAKRHLVADATFDRRVSDLWQYAGHGDPARKRAKGMTKEEAFGLGSPNLKMIVHLLSESAVRARAYSVKDATNPKEYVRVVRTPPPRYAEVYDLRRLTTAMRMHGGSCVRCGPSGKPALPGSPWSKAHQHADALRIVGKEILRDLWVAAKKEEETGHGGVETHSPHAGSSVESKAAAGQESSATQIAPARRRRALSLK